MNYALGHALTVEEMMFPLNSSMKESCKKSKITKEEVAKIFRSSVKLILDDIIDNNATFELPTQSKTSKLKMRRVDGEDFIKARQNGAFQDIDFLASDFSAYQLIFEYQNGGVIRDKRVHLSPQDTKRITEHINNGKSYY